MDRAGLFHVVSGRAGGGSRGRGVGVGGGGGGGRGRGRGGGGAVVQCSNYLFYLYSYTSVAGEIQ